MDYKNDKPEVVWDRFWNQTSNKILEWDDLSELIYRTLLHENIIKHISTWNNKKVLEVGCGTG
jgi:ubiquinone/menaquinone biosynthesis C-methylase UbiE